MNVQFNFFAWLREGVRQAILLGVSDAVEEIGLPPDGEEISTRLARAIKHDSSGGAIGASGADSSKRRRLGRSLRDLDAPAGGAADGATRPDKAA